jgi:RiboL-PSP-HEPN
MRSPTPHYRTLCKSLKKARLIVNGINELECETDLQHLKLQAYILLCHSALEQYIEELGLSAAIAARKAFVDSGVITKTLVALISSKLIDDISEKGKMRLSAELVSNIEEFSRYRSVVTANNGIIKRNQQNIFVPIGVDPSSIDLALTNNLHAFGSSRGDVAHKFRVRRTDTLSAVSTNLATIVSGVIALDEAVCKALRARMR